MADLSGGSPKRRRVRYTIGGKTAFFVSESSSGFIAGVGELAPDAARRFHLTSIKGEKGFEAHITDQRGEAPPARVPPTPTWKMIRRIRRLSPFVHKYRWNEVAWLPIGSMAERIDSISRPELVAGREVLPLERMRQRIRIDLWDPNSFRKVRMSELAQLGKVGYRYEGRVLHFVAAAKDGAVLVLPMRRAKGLMNLVLEGGGISFDPYFAHVDRFWPESERPKHENRKPNSSRRTAK